MGVDTASENFHGNTIHILAIDISPVLTCINTSFCIDLLRQLQDNPSSCTRLFKKGPNSGRRHRPDTISSSVV